MFTQDRNLLTLEPSLFRDCSWLAQQLGRGEARLESGHAIFESGSINRDAAQPGMVLLVGRAPLEITQIIDEHDVVVSLLRPSLDADPIPPADRSAAPAVCTTFTPQIALMHAQILAMLGLAPRGTPNTLPDQLTEDHITNPHDLALLESLGALHLIFAGLAATTGPDSIAWQKADMYAKRTARERFRAQAKLDTDADGQPDVARRCAVIHLIRS